MSYQWQFGDGRSGTGRNPTHVYDAPGTHAASVTVSDGKGGSDTASASVTIRPVNQRPTARIVGPAEGEVGAPLSFDGRTSSDPDGDALTYSWSFGDGSSAMGGAVEHEYATTGSFTLTLTVSDGRRGGTHATSTVVRVNPRNQPPGAVPGGPYAGLVGEPLAFDGAGSTDPDGDALTYRWMFGDGGSATGAKPSHVYAAAGTFTVRLTVEDGRGGSDTKSATVVVEVPPNRPPVARPGGPYEGEVGESITFSGAASSDADGDALTHRWDFGDGTEAAGPNAAHAYAEARNYIATLFVTDTHLASHSATTSVVVRPTADRAPPMVAITGPATALPGTTVKVVAEASDNVGVVTVIFEVNDTDAVVDSEPPYERSLALPPVVAPGTTFAVKATARDAAGNAAAATHSVRITTASDTQPPTVTLNRPRKASPGSTVLLTAHAADNVQVRSVSFLFGASAPSTDTAAPYEAAFTMPSTATVGSTVTVVAQAEDPSGNRGEARGTIDVVADGDGAPPTVSVTAPNEVVAGQRVTITAEAQDDEGVADVVFSVDGAVVGTDVGAPYAVEIQVPALARAGSEIRVAARVRDFAAKSATGEALMRVSGATHGIVTGEVYDDGTGLPLAGVSVALVGADARGQAYAESATTDAAGRYLLRAAAGSAMLEARKAGWTGADRSASIEGGQATELIDARLTRVTGEPTSVSIAGGEVAHGLARLVVPPGARPTATALRVQPVGAQGVQAVLPLGWTPLAAVDLQPHGLAFDVPASLLFAAPPGVAPGTPMVAVRWDEGARYWRAVSLLSTTESGLRLDAVDGTGQYVFLRADLEPAAPPAPVLGERIEGASTEPSLQDAQAEIRPQPKILFYKPGVHSDVTSRLTAAGPLASGQHFQSRVAESYRFTSGDAIHPDAYTQDLFFYQEPGEPRALRSEYPVTPSRVFAPATFDEGTITLELSPVAPAAPSSVVGPGGGTVTTAAGTTLVVPAGALGAAVPVRLDPVTAAPTGVVPLTLSFSGGVDVSLGSAVLTDGAVLSIPRPPSVEAGDAILLVRVDTLDGRTRLVLVGWGRVDGDRVVGETVLPVNRTRMEGVRQGARYLFVESAQPVGFAAGQVLGVDGTPFAGGLVQGSRVDVVAVSMADGRYVAAIATGASVLTAVDVVRRDSGSASVAITAAREETAADVRLRALPPRVVSAVPSNGAANVPLSSPIVITFSEPIDPASIGGSAVTLSAGGTPVAAAVTLSSNDTVLTLRPAAALLSDTAYTVRLEPTIRDRSGHTLGAAFVATFSSLDTKPPDAPPAGTITLVLDGVFGTVTVTGAPGTANPHDSVWIDNLSQGTSTPALIGADGGFSTSVEALVGDKIRIRVIDQAGNLIVIPAPIPTMNGLDGSTVALVDSAGGTVGGPGGITVDVPQGAFETPTFVVLRPAEPAAFAVEMTPAQQELFEFIGGLRLDLGAPVKQGYLKMSLPARPTDVPDDQWLVAQPVQLPDRQFLAMTDTAKLIDGRITTSSPPCPGIRQSGTFGLFKARQPFSVAGTALSTGAVALASTTTLTTTPVPMPIIGFSSPGLNPDGRICLPVLRGSTTADGLSGVTAEEALSFEITVKDGAGSVVASTTAPVPPPNQPALLPPVTGDHQAPVLDRTSPGWLVGIDPATAIELIFSEAVDPATLSAPGAVVLREVLASGGTRAVPLSLRVTAGNRSATVVPEAPLRFASAYRLSLSGIADSTGNIIDSRVIDVTTFAPRRISELSTEPLKGVALLKRPGASTAVVVTDAPRGEPQIHRIDVTNPRAPTRTMFNDAVTAHQRGIALLPNASSVQGGDLAVTSSLYYSFSDTFPSVHTHVTFYDLSQSKLDLLGTKILTTHPLEPPPIRHGTVRAEAPYPRRATLVRNGGADVAYLAVSNSGVFSVDADTNIPTVPGSERQLEGFHPGDYVDAEFDTDQLFALESTASRLDVFGPRLTKDTAPIASVSLPDRPRRIVLAHLVNDSDGDGAIEPDERFRLAVIAGHRRIQVVDLQSRTLLGNVPVARIRDIAVDAARRRLYGIGAGVLGSQEGLVIIDLSHPSIFAPATAADQVVDKDGDGLDDRILWQHAMSAKPEAMHLDAAEATLYLATSAGLATYDVGRLPLDLVWRQMLNPRRILIREGSRIAGYEGARVKAEPRFSGGTFQWEVIDPGVADVVVDPSNPATALLKGLKPGETELRVTYTLGGEPVVRSIPLKVIHPIVLIHGFKSEGKRWDEMGLAGALKTVGLKDNDRNAVAIGPRCEGVDASEDIDFCVVDFAAHPVSAAADFVGQAEFLHAEIGKLRSVTGATRVSLVAHSMGGLVARAYLQLRQRQDVDHLVTFGTPHLGTEIAGVGTEIFSELTYAMRAATPISGAQLDAVRPESLQIHQLNVRVGGQFLHSLPLPPVTRYTSIVAKAPAAVLQAQVLILGVACAKAVIDGVTDCSLCAAVPTKWTCAKCLYSLVGAPGELAACAKAAPLLLHSDGVIEVPNASLNGVVAIANEVVVQDVAHWNDTPEHYMKALGLD